MTWSMSVDAASKDNGSCSSLKLQAACCKRALPCHTIPCRVHDSTMPRPRRTNINNLMAPYHRIVNLDNNLAAEEQRQSFAFEVPSPSSCFKNSRPCHKPQHLESRRFLFPVPKGGHAGTSTHIDSPLLLPLFSSKPKLTHETVALPKTPHNQSQTKRGRCAAELHQNACLCFEPFRSPIAIDNTVAAPVIDTSSSHL